MDTYKKYERYIKECAVEDGYVETIKAFNFDRIEITEDGRIYFDLFHWVRVGMTYDQFTDQF